MPKWHKTAGGGDAACCVSTINYRDAQLFWAFMHHRQDAACCVSTRALRSQPARLEIVLGGYTKGVGHAIEEGKHCDYVNSLGYLIVGPTCLPKLLHVLVRGAAGSLGNQLAIVEKCTFSRGQIGVFKSSFGNGADRLI